VQGNLTCASAAELLDLSPRHIKRLKSRYRQGSAAALAHVSRGRPSHRRIPESTRNRILALARSRYAGFNDHHLHDKLVENEGFSLSRETLRRLLRASGIGSPRKRRPPAHRQRRLRSAREGQLVQLDGSPHDWLESRGPLLTALGMQDDACGKIVAAQFFPSETSEGYFCLLQSLLRRHGVPIAFYGDRNGIFVRNDDHWSLEEIPQLGGRVHVLEILDTTTAAFEFASRMAEQNFLSPEAVISFDMHSVDGRPLTWPTNVFRDSDFVGQDTWCQESEFRVARRATLIEFQARKRELALEVTLEIYSKFGWTNPPADRLAAEQHKRFGA
jgi:transposase